MRRVAAIVAAKGLGEILCAVIEAGPRQFRIDKGSRYALDLPIAWYDLPESLMDVERAVSDSRRLSSAQAMRDVVSVSRNAARSQSPHLDAIAEVAFLEDICEESERILRRPSLPPIGSRVVFARRFDIETDEGMDQSVPRGALATVVGFGVLSGDGDAEVVVWLDEYDLWSPAASQQIELWGKEVDAIRLV